MLRRSCIHTTAYVLRSSHNDQLRILNWPQKCIHQILMFITGLGLVERSGLGLEKVGPSEV